MRHDPDYERLKHEVVSYSDDKIEKLTPRLAAGLIGKPITGTWLKNAKMCLLAERQYVQDQAKAVEFLNTIKPVHPKAEVQFVRENEGLAFKVYPQGNPEVTNGRI